MKRYNPTEIEPKWQEIWAADDRYTAQDASDKPKYYVSGMFPYPSGAGMHTGHFLEHSIVDAVARFRRSLGDNVLYPMGWDSFGLPAENYAIKTGKAPAVTTAENIASFKNQLKRVGASIDWSREINTADPDYYRWTQWVFAKFFERGLAYQKEANQWWCPVDKTVLANEQVEGGKCWRCGTEVEKKSMKQWFFKITDYADALLEEIPSLGWPEKIKTAQENWIGRSEGAEVEFVVAPRHPELDSGSSKNKSTNEAWTLGQAQGDNSQAITVFSTRPDTLFGATFLVLAPEHPLARQLVTDDMRESVEHYIDEAVKKSEIERQSEGKEKTGVWTGSYAINPANGEKVPIWIADYVLGGYGTGAVMGVPAHDERDHEFAEKFDLPIVNVIMPLYIDATTPWQDDAELQERSASQVIVKHPLEDKYLLLKKLGWEIETYSYVNGGVEPGESPLDAAKRELAEEAGYKNYEPLIQIADPYVVQLYHQRKRHNLRATMYTFATELRDLEQDEITRLEQETNELVWCSPDEVRQKIHGEGARLAFDRLVDGEKTLHHGEGLLVNSGTFDGIETSQAREEIVAWLEQQGTGRSKVTYKMRDWLISRQRYWGAPIPIIHCDEHGAVAVPQDQLPVLLPEVEDYAPKGDGKSPLARQEEWVNTTCPTCGRAARRETDVMDGYACSSWYLLRFTDPHDAEQAWAPEKADYWTPIDMYIGGDHAVAHLLYVRFWNHVFHDMGLVPTKEPVKKLVYHGLVQAEDGRKMSKSLGNVVDPLEVIDAGYGADALRTFELFMGPINENSNWSSRGIAGVYRFLNRAWTLSQEFIDTKHLPSSEDASLVALQHRTIKKVTTDVHRLSFNTAIAALMEYVNELYKLKTAGFTTAWRQPIETLVHLLSIFAPHMSAELWQQLGKGDMLDTARWPTWDEALTRSETMTIVVQINGKVRAKLEVAADASEDDIKAQALSDAKVTAHLSGEPKKVIYVKNKLVSVVV